VTTAVPQGITENDIADYLVHTPAFFERHAELLATVQLTSPHGQRAVSLQERQMEMLRDRIKGLERKIVEMIRNGQDNVAIADRLHRWTRALMLTGDAAVLPALLVRELKQQFLVPQAAVRVWGVLPAFADVAAAQAASDDVKAFADSLAQPYCGPNAGYEAVSWLDDADAAASIAMVPLRRNASDRAFGLLVLASPDPTRYGADMATDFLARIGEIAGAALARLLAAP
jgi:uncharacterized protein YigA (DUF484 family)